MKAPLTMTQASVNMPSTALFPPSSAFRTNNRLSETPIPTSELTLDNRRYPAWQIAPNLLVSFKYAWAGISYAFLTQRNFRIHTIMTATAISLGLFLQVNGVSMAIVSLTCALVMVLELLNTALESVVDLAVGQSYHELAKIAKDCAAGAVMISAIAALLVGGFILCPPLVALAFAL
ncbi:diacylglycerol kinase [Aphanothece sacrum]|uniref:Diacylglycerol kinase n=1 Tax=Aphanothece sacrum FPU1 TaxID=1920663 RepID=A0A401IFU2_APHSA|nr:diacylglycerol kinase family protein [Aphanothece sacrum]GBF80162.1 diacylglycerol kinase [Aphanothece sacrum FPU1]GBF85315.1 diacylglycerol kinase [Aphanothece sacrum FPU3]